MIKKQVGGYFATLALIFIFAVKLLESLWLSSNGDPVYYHLVLPKIILLDGFVQAHREVCGALQAGLMEYLFSIPQMFFGSGLLAAKVSQMIHYLMSIGIFALILFFRYLKSDVVLSALAAIAALTVSASSATFLQAKNDGVPAMLGVLAMLQLMENSKFDFRRAISFGILLGLIPLFKINGLMLTAALAVMAIYGAFRKEILWRNLFVCGFVSAGLVCLVMIRNFYFLESPFFPGLLRLFPGALSPRMLEVYLGFMSSRPSLTSVVENIWIFLTGKIVILLGLPLLWINLRERALRLNRIFVVSVIYLALALLVNGGLVVERFLFPSIFLNLFFVFESLIQHFGTNLSLSESSRRYLLFGLCCLILVDSKLDLSLRDARRVLEERRSPSEVIRQEGVLFGFADGAIKSDLARVQILSDEFNQIYFFPSSMRLHSDECNVQAAFLTKCDDPKDLEGLSRYQYAILRYPRENPCYERIRQSWKLIKVEHGYSLYENTDGNLSVGMSSESDR